jgi:hypothetical protein
MVLQHFVGLWPLFSYLIFYKMCRTPWTGDQPVARLPPSNTGQHKCRINTHGHPCLKWELNPRSQYFSERRQFMPQAAAFTVIGADNYSACKICVVFRDVNSILLIKRSLQYAYEINTRKASSVCLSTYSNRGRNLKKFDISFIQSEATQNWHILVSCNE